MAFIIVKKGDAEDIGKTFALYKTVTLIGRTTSQNKPDIELNDEVVSRRHLEIIADDGGYSVKDLGSTNGTLVNDDRIIAGNVYKIKHNSKIGLGVEGNSSRIVLVFKESETTNIINSKDKPVSQAVAIGWLRVDEGKKEVTIDDKQKRLSKKEYDLLLFLYKHAGIICSRDEIIEAVWPETRDPSAISEATIDQLIHRLREKVEPEPSKPTRIISKKAFGYMLV